MSEFKFACPVCGQHITVGSHTSGTQLDCPTCFRRIVVPQAPSAGSKLILSAVQPAKERPKTAGHFDLGPLHRGRPGLSLAGAGLLLVLAAGAAALYGYRSQVQNTLKQLPSRLTGASPAVPDTTAVTSAPPAGTVWTLDLHQAVISDEPAAGTLHGAPFVCEHASLTGGALFLRQGRGWPPDLAVAVVLPVQNGEELSGKSIQIASDRTPPLPQVILRWKDLANQEQRQHFSGGYALNLVFGQAVTNKISGKIFIALPDETKSVVAGKFDAEIRPPRTRR